MATLEDEVSETVGLAEATPVAAATSLPNVLGVGSGLIPGFNLAFTHTLHFADQAPPAIAYPLLAEDTLGMTDALLARLGLVLQEALAIVDSDSAVGWNLGEVLGEDFNIATAVIAPVVATLSETANFADAVTTMTAVLVAEQLGITPQAVGLARYGLTLSDGLAIADGLRLFLGGSIAETLSLTPVLAGVAAKVGTVSELVGLTAAVSPSLVLRVVVEDTLDVDDVQALNMIYKPEISEAVKLSAAYLSPGGGFTAWAMNTRTGAVTEYQNFEFNSFARFGSKYVGATSDGLFELLGNDDEGEDIVATLLSGFAQFAGVHLSRFKAIYLGVRGEGDFVLRLIAGSGETYDYAVSTRDMRTTKVHIGKGLQARYFRFELISTGQDFDLESIEFVPLVKQRRV